MGLIYLIRHGETEGTAKKLFRGKLDLPLTDNGRTEAETISEKLKDKGISKIFSSPLKRAVETARPLSEKLNIPVIEDEGFNNIDVGKWEGLTLEETEKKSPSLFSIWLNSPEIFKFPHGESLEEIKEKSFNRLLEIVKENEEPVCIFTHQIVTRILLLTTMGQNIDNYWSINQVTGAINVLEFSNKKFKIHGMNIGFLEK